MTEKLYDNDSYLSEFVCKVLSFGEDKDRIYIETDRTAFFPEGGGQTSDKGTLDELYISDVQLVDGRICHYTDNTEENLQLLRSKSTLHGKIDMKKRFSDMQQHSGEHIFSGLVCSNFGYNNVGFHLGTEVVTLDFDGVLLQKDIDRIELLANKAIWDNKEILIHFPTDDELKKISYRSKIEIEGQTRLVEIPGIDICACCAPHVKMTGEIGIIEVVAFEKYKGGTRVSILCGERALKDIRHKLEENRKVSVLTSAKQNETSLFVQKLKEDKEKADYDIVGLKRELLLLKAEAIEKAERIIIFDEKLQGKLLQDFSISIMNKTDSFAACFCGENGVYRYSIASKGKDLREMCKAFNGAFKGRGGGKPELCQGTVSGTEEEIRKFLSDYKI